MQISVISDLDHLSPLEPAWRDLYRAAGCENPFLGWDWIYTWFTVFADQLRPWLCIALDADGSLAAALPLQRAGGYGRPRLECLAVNGGADDLDLLAPPDVAPSLVESLLQAGLEGGRWHWCRLHAVRAEGPLAAFLLANHRRLAWTVRSRHDEYLPFLRLPDRFDDFLQLKSANFRSEIRRRQRQWLRQVAPLELRVAESAPDLQAALPDLFRLHNLRRGAKGQLGVFADARTRCFHTRLCAALAARSEVRIYRLMFCEQTAAVLYGYANGERFFFFQSGLHPHFEPQRPGTVLMSLVVEDLIRRGTRVFELLRGSESYKLRWATHGRHNLQFTLLRDWRGHGAMLASRAWSALRNRARVRHKKAHLAH